MRSLTDGTFLVRGYFVFALFIGGISLVHAAEDPQSSQAPEQSAPASGDVQERGIRRGQFGGAVTKPPVVNPRPTGFYCLQSKNTCYCDRTVSNDCDLMKSLVCAPGTYENTTVLDGECTARTS
jgi:hypothetical protein